MLVRNKAFTRGKTVKDALDLGVKKKIHDWMDMINVANYEITPYLEIRTQEQVIIQPSAELFVSFKDIFPDGRFPSYIQFEYVDGDFDIDDAELVSLRGCPDIIRGYFSCQMNELENFIGGPDEVYGSYYGSSNPLKSLEGLARNISGDLDIENNVTDFDVKEIRKISNIRGDINKQW